MQLIEGELTGRIIGAFYECYNNLRFGYLESVYRRALAVELRLRGLQCRQECPIDVVYKGVAVGHYRIDLLVEHRIVVEVKASSSLGPNDKRQILHYLRATNLQVGLLVHFGPEAEFHRVVNERPAHDAMLPRGSDPAASA